MKLGDILIPAMIGLALIAGIVSGAKCSASRLRRIQSLVTIALACLTILIITVAVEIAVWSPNTPEWFKLTTFWMLAAIASFCLFGFFAGITAIFRKEHRSLGVRLSLLSASFVPIAIVVVESKRAIMRWLG